MGYRVRKPNWQWKPREAAELEDFDISFAVKEYVQNQVGQALKELGVRKWSDWTSENLLEQTTEIQQERKKELDETYPGMLSGPHGASTWKRKWLPVYILSKVTKRKYLPYSTYRTPLKRCIVLWHNECELTGLSFYNNHLDPDASFETFVVDGATTSRWTKAVGQRGKGFILASQYLQEQIGAPFNNRHPQNLKLGVSFRVGHKVGELIWGKPSRGSRSKVLKARLDDLSPLTEEEFVAQRSSFFEDTHATFRDSD